MVPTAFQSPTLMASSRSRRHLLPVVISLAAEAFDLSSGPLSPLSTGSTGTNAGRALSYALSYDKPRVLFVREGILPY